MMQAAPMIAIFPYQNTGYRLPGLLCLLSAAVLPLPPAHANDLQPLGRLLSTPAQRAQLDQLRKNTGKAIPPAPNNSDDIILLPNPVAKPPPVVQDSPPAPPVPVVFNGYVMRSQGKGTVWLNQVAVSDAPVRKTIDMKLGDGRTISIRPGQTVEPERGHLHDVLPAGQIVVVNTHQTR